MDCTIIVQSGDAAAARAAVFGAVGASAITGIITYLVTRRQVTAEDDRWFASQEAARRAALADRPRGIYGTVAQAAASLQVVISERSFVTSRDETEEARNERHDQMVNIALNTVSAYGGALLIETSAEAVRDAYSLWSNSLSNISRLRRSHLHRSIEGRKCRTSWTP